MLNRCIVTLLLSFFLLYTKAQSVGTPKLQAVPKILNGHTTNKFTPWMVYFLQYSEENGVLRCAGTLIHDQWVMTAAHCLENTSVQNTFMLLDPSYVDLTSMILRGGKKVKAENFYIHPDYKHFENNVLIYDIALIKLTSPVTNAQPIRLMQQGVYSLQPGAHLTVYGWGIIDALKTVPVVLQEATLALSSKDECDRRFIRPGRVPYGPYFCARSLDPFIIQNTCGGDSGGPIIYQGSGEPLQVGITSWGTKCGQSNSSVYTDVRKLGTFIENVQQGKVKALQSFSPVLIAPVAPVDTEESITEEKITLQKSSSKSGGSTQLNLLLLLGSLLVMRVRRIKSGAN